ETTLHKDLIQDERFISNTTLSKSSETLMNSVPGIRNFISSENKEPKSEEIEAFLGKVIPDKDLKIKVFLKNSVSILYSLLEYIAEAYLLGEEINWDAFYDGKNKQTISLPPYAFSHKSLWPD